MVENELQFLSYKTVKNSVQPPLNYHLLLRFWFFFALHQRSRSKCSPRKTSPNAGFTSVPPSSWRLGFLISCVPPKLSHAFNACFLLLYSSAFLLVLSRRFDLVAWSRYHINCYWLKKERGCLAYNTKMCVMFHGISDPINLK